MVNRNNYHLIKAYLRYQKGRPKVNQKSVDRYWFYLRHLLLWADETPFAQANTVKINFEAYAKNLPGKNNQGNNSAESLKKVINLAKAFFQWVKAEFAKEFRSLPTTWIDKMEAPQVKQHSLVGEHEYVSLEEVLQLVSNPADPSDIALMRDQAAAAFLFLTGMRAGAFTTLPIKAVRLDDMRVDQWPELGVETKNDRKATTTLYYIPELLAPIRRWNEYVRANLSEFALWYAPVESHWGVQTIKEVFTPVMVKEFQRTTGKMGYDLILASANGGIHLDKQLKKLFGKSSLEYKSAHRFRHGCAVFGLQHARNMADYQAVSRNLMHSNIQITDEIYSGLVNQEIHDRILRMSTHSSGEKDEELLEHFKRMAPRQQDALLLVAESMAD